MIEAETLKSIATQLMTSTSVSADGKSIPVRRTSRQRLRTMAFTVAGHEYQAIEQNPEKPSRWGQLARSGHQVVQFKDAENNRFVAVVVGGEVTFYGASKRRRWAPITLPKRTGFRSSQLGQPVQRLSN
jgi:hypothetical protein